MKSDNCRRLVELGNSEAYEPPACKMKQASLYYEFDCICTFYYNQLNNHPMGYRLNDGVGAKNLLNHLKG